MATRAGRGRARRAGRGGARVADVRRAGHRCPARLPLAVSVPDGEALAPVVARLVEQGGDAVSWRPASPPAARPMLEDAEVYGVLELDPAVGTAVAVLASLAVLGLVVLVWPARRTVAPAVAEREPALAG